MMRLLSSAASYEITHLIALAEKAEKLSLESLRFNNLPLTKTMYLATRHEDVALEYIQGLIELASNRPDKSITRGKL